MALSSRQTRGIEIEIGGNATRLKTALDGANRSIRATQTELDTLRNSLKLEWNADNFRRAQELAQRAVQETTNKARLLQQALEELTRQGVGSDTEQYQAIQRELSYTRVAAQRAEEQLRTLNNLPFDELKRAISEASATLGKMGDRLTTGVTLPLAAAGAASIKFASDMTESLNKVDVAFGEAAGVVKSWSDSTLRDIGLAKGTALDMAALFGDMATSMGYGTAEAADMSISLVKLAADMASFKNISIDQAATALKSIFTGETESLKNLGVVMTEVNLKNFALEQGFSKSYDQLSQLEKVQLRYQYVMAQTGNAQGDFARTVDGTANQLRICQESLKELAATGGEELLPIITPIIAKVNELLQSFGGMDDETKELVTTTLLFTAALGPMLKLTSVGTTAINGAIAAYAALKAAMVANQAATVGATATQTGLNVAMSANPVGLLITGIGTLVAVVGSYALATALTTEKTETLTQRLEDSRKAYADTREELEKGSNSMSATASAITRLAETEHKTVAEKETLLGLIQQLNEEMPGLNLAYDEQTDSLNLTTEALLAMVEARAMEEERAAAVDRMVELERERMQIENDLAAAVAAQEKAVAAKNKAVEEGVYSDIACVEQTALLDEAVKTATKSVAELTAEKELNQVATEEATAAYGSLQAAQAKSGAVSKELTEKTGALTAAQENLAAAINEQETQGSLNLDTQEKLIAAGYESALATDTETGAVKLNQEAYVKSALAKMEDHLATLEARRASAQARAALLEEAQAANETAIAHYKKAEAAQVSKMASMDSRKAAAAQLVTYDKEIAALRGAMAAIGQYGTATTTAARSSSTASRKIQTQAEKNLAAYKTLRAELDHSLAMGEITEAEHYERLAQYRDSYLTDSDNVDEYRKINEEIFKYDQKLADEELALWEAQTGALLTTLENRFQATVEKQNTMIAKLTGYGDLFKIEEDTLSLENLEKQTEAIRQYGDTLKALEGKGISDSLLDEVISMGVDDATAYGQALLDLSQEQWDEYNDAWREKQAEAKRVAETFYKTELDTLQTEYNEKLTEALDPLKLTAFTSGQDTAQGLIDGLSNKEAALYTKAAAVAREMERILSSSSVTVKTVDGSHAMGLPYVPFDGYVAELHRGERVLTAEEAQSYIARAMPRSYEPPRAAGPDFSAQLGQAMQAMHTAAPGGALPDLVINLTSEMDGAVMARKTYRYHLAEQARHGRALVEV